ncbi:MAG: winged helix-turn-helix domain-containing protein [Dehalococcoidia bacterium]|nr:winged helix-turn-helix domain-containing protein [Dehalococcoidia bacterium]MDW8120649.1 HTH domain-containing protein [Chloroflexota bacterium]
MEQVGRLSPVPSLTQQDDKSGLWLQELQATRQRLITELQSVDASLAQIHAQYVREIKPLEQKKKILQEKLDHVDALLRLEGLAVENPSTQQERGRRPVDVAYDVLCGYGKPMHYRMIAEKVLANGVYIGGKDPAANLLTQITRDKRFVQAGQRGYYALVSWGTETVSARRKRRSRSQKSGNKII